MVYFTTLFAVAAAIGALATPLEKRTVAQVEADLATISTDVSNLNTAINNFPNSGGTLAEALAIHSQATSLNGAITNATNDVKGTGPVGETDAVTIIHTVQGFQPTIISALNAIITKKAAFDALPLGGVSALVKSDLGTLNSSTTAFENSLIAASPTDLKSNATAIATAVNAAFSSAIAAYANA